MMTEEMMTEDQLAEILWDAYRVSCGGVSKFTGDTLPPFDRMEPDIQHHWCIVARAAMHELVVEPDE